MPKKKAIYPTNDIVNQSTSNSIFMSMESSEGDILIRQNAIEHNDILKQGSNQ